MESAARNPLSADTSATVIPFPTRARPPAAPAPVLPPHLVGACPEALTRLAEKCEVVSVQYTGLSLDLQEYRTSLARLQDRVDRLDRNMVEYRKALAAIDFSGIGRQARCLSALMDPWTGGAGPNNPGSGGA